MDDQLEAVVDFGGRRMKLMGGDWQEIKKGKHGAMLLRLAENVQHASQLANPTSDLVSEEADHDEVENFEAYLRDMHAHKRYAELHAWVKSYLNISVSSEASENVQIPVSWTLLQMNRLSWRKTPPSSRSQSNPAFSTWLLEQAKEVRREVNGLVALDCDGAPAKTKLIWEVYAGAGRITECAQPVGARVERFGLQDGWDFSKASHRRALVQQAAQDEPDEIFLSPRCTLWSPMQNINVKDKQDAQLLQSERELDHDTHAVMWSGLTWKSCSH